jgi:hypothetical protein
MGRSVLLGKIVGGGGGRIVGRIVWIPESRLGERQRAGREGVHRIACGATCRIGDNHCSMLSVWRGTSLNMEGGSDRMARGGNC